MSRLSTEELKQIAENGYVVVASGLDAQALCELSGLLDTSHAGVRNLLDVPVIRQLARSSAVRDLGVNWKVAWHQDCVIVVAERKEIGDLGQLKLAFTTFVQVLTFCHACSRFASTWTNAGAITALCE